MHNLMRRLLLLLLISMFSPLLMAEQVLYRGNAAEPEALDPHYSTGVPEANIQRELFEGLVSQDAAGKLIPGVAQSWDISEDGLTYTFTLRDAAQWSDGEPLTAADFVFAYQRALAPETASDYAFILWPLANAEAYSKGELDDPSKIGVQALDEHTLQLRLSEPTPYLLELLTHHMAYPLPKHLLEDWDKEAGSWVRPDTFVGNGAYQLAEWRPQAHIKVIKNPRFRAYDELAIDTVYFIPTDNQQSELKRFRAGELHITDGVPISQIDWIKDNLADAYRVTPYIGTYYLSLNTTRAPLDKQKLRQALSLAIDRDILVDKILKGGEVATYKWLPPGVNNYENITVPAQEMSRAERHALAKTLYAESGYSADAPLEIEYLYNTSDSHKKVAIAISAMWKQVLGVQTQLRNEEWKVYLSTRRAKDFSVLRAGWIGDYNDPYTFLSLFKSDVGEINSPGYASAAYDQYLKQAERTLDLDKRAALFQQAEQTLLDDAPIIPIYHYNTKRLVSPKVKGWQDNVMDVHPTRYLSLDD